MIRYALLCDEGHGFESWFADSAAFDRQKKRKLIACPVCGSSKIEKALMTPRVAGGRKRNTAKLPEPAETPAAEAAEAPAPAAPVAIVSPEEQEFRSKLKELRSHLLKNSENVGGKFPEEARKMHYGEVEHRSIYGVASQQDAKELAEEGIEFHPLPVLPDERN
jgi:hypothetical protein